MNSLISYLRRNVITSNKINNLVKEEIHQPEIDNPEFYDIETKTLKLGILCARDIKTNKTPNIEMGGKLYTTYCALTQLSNTLDKNLVPKFQHNIDKVYNFLRRDLKYDNRVKFHSLMKSILEYDDPANTLNIIVNFIEDTDSVDEIAIALDSFRKTDDINENDIDKFLRYVKSAGHQEYEKSFYGEHFKKNSTKLVLKYKTEKENRSILGRIEDVIDGKYSVDKAVSILYQNIVDNYSAEEMIKSDLECIKTVYNDKGDEIIKNGDYLEVKKIDYAADSYLSEFMAMYKSSQLPDYAHENNFIKIYNQIIDGLFVKFNKRKDILEDVKRNFAGIIYDDKIFIKKDDIELYWSNKGRTSCLKDHRLSIRYRITKNNLTGYVYEGGDVLTEKPIQINLSSEEIFCPIIKSSKINESISINDLGNLLLEGRKEDARTKYPKFSDEVFDYYVENDPSGNQKYLDWLLKNTNPDYENPFEVHNHLLSMINTFHQNQNMFIEKDINKHTLTTLDREINDVLEKKVQKKEEKQAKKEKTIIYSDDRWLVVNPHSWKASCFYGAGTKWCITMKNYSQYWDKYTKKASFYFIIDKTKNQDDPLYKVAYRIIGSGNKYELWNAEDDEISGSEKGITYFNNLPSSIKELAGLKHQEKFPKVEGLPSWYEDDPRAQALYNQIESENIEPTEDYYYDMPIYEADGDHSVVGSSNEMEDALYQRYNEYDDSDLLEYYDPEGYYLGMDEDLFISDEVNSYLENINDRETLEGANKYADWLELESKINELEGVGTKEEILSLLQEQEDLIEESKDILSDFVTRDWERCFRYGGIVGCLVDEKEWFRDIYELLRTGLVWLNRDDLISTLVGNADYGNIAYYGYNEVEDNDGNSWIVFSIDY